MKQWMKKRKSRGFTLVELLIVIVIIGILAGSLLLVMGSGTDKANATKIVSDMRTLKAAALMHYADNDAWPADLAAVRNYLDRDPSTSNTVATLAIVGSGVVSGDCAIEATVVDTGAGARLVVMADEAGLLDADYTESTATGAAGDTFYMAVSQ
jgi:general secretion pathway protein G